MDEWRRQFQFIVDEMDDCIRRHKDDALTLRSLSRRLGYSEFHMTRKFREIAGLSLRDYLRRRRLAFSLIEVRDSDRSILDIALDYGFSSHEAFTRAFRSVYGVRLPADYDGGVPPQMLLTDVPEGEYVVFEHGPFDYEQENQSVDEKVETAIKSFSFEGTGYRLNGAPGRIAYMYHDPARFWKEIRPIRKDVSNA